MHARHPFSLVYLASPRTPEDILDPNDGCTVTGRKLIGLKTFGYELHPNASPGEVLECTNQARPPPPSIPGVRGRVPEGETPETAGRA